VAQICTKSFVGWGFAPDPTGEAYSAPSDPLAGLGGGAPGKWKEGEEEEKEGGEGVPECPNSELASLNINMKSQVVYQIVLASMTFSDPLSRFQVGSRYFSKVNI